MSAVFRDVIPNPFDFAQGKLCEESTFLLAESRFLDCAEAPLEMTESGELNFQILAANLDRYTLLVTESVLQIVYGQYQVKLLVPYGIIP